jgi:hypothetical protein
MASPAAGASPALGASPLRHTLRARPMAVAPSIPLQRTDSLDDGPVALPGATSPQYTPTRALGPLPSVLESARARRTFAPLLQPRSAQVLTLPSHPSTPRAAALPEESWPGGRVSPLQPGALAPARARGAG